MVEMKTLYLFEKSGAVVEIIPGSEFTSEQYGKCVSVRKLPDGKEMFVPRSALKKLSAAERGTFIHKELEKVLGK